MTKYAFELGQKLRDKITGFEGIAIIRLEYLNGCIQYCLQSKVEKGQKFDEGHYFDQQQLVADEAPAIAPQRRMEAQVTGGPVQGNPPKIYGRG